jgi:hypothetical protein
MLKYLSEHEKQINELLKKEREVDWMEILKNHRAVVNNLQHERLSHLLVTLTFGIIFVVLMIVTLMYQLSSLIIFELLILVLLIPYIFHYFQLENGIQRLYKLDNEIQSKIIN